MHANAVVDTIYKIIPEATIHFYSEDFDNLTESRFEALEHIIEYNKNAVEKEKIKVISVSAGILNQFKKPPEMLINRLKKIKEDFKKDGCVIVDSNEYAKFFSIASPKYNKQFTGVLDWEYGEEWINRYKERYKEVIEKKKKENILVPGGGRLYAIPGQKTEYVYCGSASYSWSIPCVAAMIAMLKTKNKDLLLEDFFELALQKCDYSDDGWRVINLNTMYKGCF